MLYFGDTENETIHSACNDLDLQRSLNVIGNVIH